ncbi:MAG TPA: cell wall hydrolase [Candidatus Eisenbergiella merdigallinarum]|uniref:Cell wall hydrolase n=1 Tax=Candidatus Eisenbergiella merdigallinarum TaxID=2838552 RepID=A0A9D2MR55_9FIRM|nr:cell wall hydrolase [Candidatus Eisenbergiella merdigallinarum]
MKHTDQKRALCLLLYSLTAAAAWLCVRGVELEKYAAASAFDPKPIESVEALLDYERQKESASAERAGVRQPVIDVSLLEKDRIYEISGEDYETLLKIVEAEAGSEDEEGKLLVANVVLNRVKSDDFPDTVTEVVYQRDGGVAQFSPAADGSLSEVEAGAVSRETVSAVCRALQGEDNSRGALYFAARSAADAENMRWFDTHLTRLFAYGGHEFFS